MESHETAGGFDFCSRIRGIAYLPKLRTAADILVTDQAERYGGIEGMSRKAWAEYEACLGE